MTVHSHRRLCSLLLAVGILYTSDAAAGIPPPPPPPPPPSLNHRVGRGSSLTTDVSKKSTRPSPPLEPASVVSKRPLSTTEEYNNNSSNNHPSSSIRTSNNNNNKHHQNATHSVLQITETELWDGTQWTASSSATLETSHKQDVNDNEAGSCSSSSPPPLLSRWTNTQGEACAAPDKQTPGENAVFEGDWKILTNTSTHDAYGWEYTHQRPFPVRQRVWLRTVVAVKPEATATTTQQAPASSLSGSTTGASVAMDDRASTKTTWIPFLTKKKGVKASTAVSKSSTKASTPTKKRRRKLPRLFRSIADDFNFKGFGFSFYKSIIFPTSFGMALRLPLTFNFDTWETIRSLPSISTSIGCFYPFSAMIYLSASMRLESLQWLVARALWTAHFVAVCLVWNIYRFLLLMASAMLFPLTHQFLVPPVLPPVAATAYLYSALLGQRPPPASPQYRRNVDERLGVSVRWGVSAASGYSFRVSYWHYYGPTLSGIWKQADQVVTAASNAMKDVMTSSGSTNAEEPRKTSVLGSVPAWFARRTPSVGLSVSGPIVEQPHFSGSLSLSTSGYYFRSSQSRRTPSNTKVRVTSKTTKTSSISTTKSSNEVSSSRSATTVKTSATTKTPASSSSSPQRVMEREADEQPKMIRRTRGGGSPSSILEDDEQQEAITRLPSMATVSA